MAPTKPGTTPAPRRAPRDVAALAVAALAYGGYFLAAQAFDNVFPFSTFPMYSGSHDATGSRIVARDQSGALHEVTRASRWDCEPEALAGDLCREPGVYTIQYVDDDAINYVRRHQGRDPQARPVDLVRHVWAFSTGPGAPTTRDCVIARCRAVLP